MFNEYFVEYKNFYKLQSNQIINVLFKMVNLMNQIFFAIMLLASQSLTYWSEKLSNRQTNSRNLMP